MKFFETTLVFTAMQAIAYGEQVNSENQIYGSPSDFKMERYGSHSPEYYYDSYTPRAPVGDHPRSYSATRPPVRHMHHEH